MLDTNAASAGFRRVSPLAERYFLGDREVLLEGFGALHDAGHQMLAKARKSRQDL